MNYNTVHPPQAPQPAAPAPVTYNVPPAQTGAAPVFYSMPQPSSGGNIRKHYNIKCVTGLCITIMVLGIICFIAQVVNIGLKSELSVTGGGIFGGFFYILTASIGIYSAKSRTTCPIVAFLVLSILSAMISVFPLTIGSIDVGMNAKKEYRDYDYNDYYPEHDRHKVQRTSYVEVDSDATAKLAMGAIMIITGLLNAVLLVISSGFACHGLCPEHSQRGAVLIAGQVHYVTGPNGQQQMVIIPIGGQPQPMVAAPGMVLPYGQNWTSQPGAVAGASAPVQNAPVQSAPVQPPAYGRQLTPPPEYKEQLTSVE